MSQIAKEETINFGHEISIGDVSIRYSKQPYGRNKDCWLLSIPYDLDEICIRHKDLEKVKIIIERALKCKLPKESKKQPL